MSVKNSKNGSLNPAAQFQKPLSSEQVLSSRVISDPLTLYMCSPIADGAAAAILVSERKARQLGIRNPVYLRGSILMSGIYQRKENDACKNSIAESGRRVFIQSDMGPHEIDLLEVHDAAAHSEIENLESLGFIPEGTGYDHLKMSTFDLYWELPVNTSGGLLSRGHPVGATGVAQIYEIVKQLRGDAGKRNIHNGKKLKAGLCLNTGGRVEDDRAAIVTTILSL